MGDSARTNQTVARVNGAGVERRSRKSMKRVRRPLQAAVGMDAHFPVAASHGSVESRLGKLEFGSLAGDQARQFLARIEKEAFMETFKKRQKEQQRLERQRDKAEKRRQIKLRKAAGLPDPSDEVVESTAETVPQVEDVSTATN